MAFAFEITRIHRLAKAHVGVLDGKLLEGSVTTDSTADLLHGGRQFPVLVKGVVLVSTDSDKTTLSLTVDLREAAMQFAAVGDKLVCD